MDKELQNSDDKKVNVNLISVGSAALAGVYQYTLLNKSNPAMNLNKKLLFCTGAGIICFAMTRIMLKNINSL